MEYPYKQVDSSVTKAAEAANEVAGSFKEVARARRVTTVRAGKEAAGRSSIKDFERRSGIRD
jgi:hypothetical protein